VAWSEPHERAYVDPLFLKTNHGKIPCHTCHKGNPEESDWLGAHKGIVRDPTFPDADKACGPCHESIASTAKNSLHYTLAPFENTVRARSNKKDKGIIERVSRAREKHCSVCHSSCGQCHVSLPDFVEGGFLDGHLFQGKPPMDITCASCHSGRRHKEYTGGNAGYAADVHYEKARMTCMDCHSSLEMHADAKGVANRLDRPERPRCESCHWDVISENPSVQSHKTHKDKVACQVCHGTAYKNCFGCHVGTDKQGRPYYKSRETKMLFKIGINPNRTQERPYEYVVLRHPPADPGLFDFYVKDGLSDFDKLPTWKLDTPHNIQRVTEQNRSCNNCHGKASLFLRREDVTDWEQKANAEVVVPESRIPLPVNNLTE